MSGKGPKRYEALILDFDGTLVSTLDDVTSCMTETFRAFGIDSPSKERVRSTMGLSLEESFRRLCQGGCSNIEEWVRIYRERYAVLSVSKTSLFPGVREFLECAKANGIYTVIVSNKGTAAINSALERLELMRFVTVVFAGDTIAYKKPDPKLYECQILPLIQPCPRENTLVVGDTVTDLEFANNCALDSCWVSYGYGDRERCLQLSPTYVVDSLCDIAATIEKNASKRVDCRAVLKLLQS